ncbi:hypothetical protein FQZ97_554750 [compost metagenome]
MAHRLEQAAHLAIAAFGNGHAVPAVGAFATTVFDGAELRHAVVQAHALEQLLLFFAGERAQHAHRVLALQAEARVHELVGQIAGAAEQQQAFGVQVEPADRLPLALLQTRQLAEHRRAVLRIVVRDDLAHGLVVRDHARRRRCDAVADRLAVDLDLVAVLDALADVGWLVVDRDAALQDELLHLEARTKTGLRQHLVQLGRIGLGQQHALERRHLGTFLVGVELAGNDVGKTDRLGRRRVALLALGGAAGAVEVVFLFVGLVFLVVFVIPAVVVLVLVGHPGTLCFDRRRLVCLGCHHFRSHGRHIGLDRRGSFRSRSDFRRAHQLLIGSRRLDHLLLAGCTRLLRRFPGLGPCRLCGRSDGFNSNFRHLLGRGGPLPLLDFGFDRQHRCVVGVG